MRHMPVFDVFVVGCAIVSCVEICAGYAIQDCQMTKSGDVGWMDLKIRPRHVWLFKVVVERVPDGCFTKYMDAERPICQRMA